MGLYLSHPSSLEHDTGAHPENASRIRAIEAKLQEAGWPGLERIEGSEIDVPALGLDHPIFLLAVADQHGCAKAGSGPHDRNYARCRQRLIGTREVQKLRLVDS